MVEWVFSREHLDHTCNGLRNTEGQSLCKKRRTTVSCQHAPFRHVPLLAWRRGFLSATRGGMVTRVPVGPSASRRNLTKRQCHCYDVPVVAERESSNKTRQLSSLGTCPLRCNKSETLKLYRCYPLLKQIVFSENLPHFWSRKFTIMFSRATGPLLETDEMSPHRHMLFIFIIVTSTLRSPKLSYPLRISK